MKSSFHIRIPFLPSLLNHSTTISRDSLNYSSAGLGSSLYSLGADPRENTVSFVIAQQYLDCCLFIRCRGDLFIESLPSNERLLWLRYSGFRRHVTIFKSATATPVCSVNPCSVAWRVVSFRIKQAVSKYG
jgi:hypothetical protein